MAGVAHVSGYALCIAEGGHTEIEYVNVDGCGDNPNELKKNSSKASLAELLPYDEHCGPCFDLSVQQSDAAFSKRLNKKAPISVDAVESNHIFAINSQSVQRVLGNLVSQPLPRISQNILDLRTIIFLI